MPTDEQAPPPSQRARPLSPEQRRVALVATTLPLLREHGLEVSTRQIAQAAGVAEGTIFRAFPDKESLITATIAAALDPASPVEQLRRIPPDLPLDATLTQIVDVTRAWVRSVITLMMTIRHSSPAPTRQPHKPATSPDDIENAVVDLLKAHANELRLPPRDVSRFLRMLVFSSSHPMLSRNDPMPTDVIVDTVLNGVHRRAEGEPCC